MSTVGLLLRTERCRGGRGFWPQRDFSREKKWLRRRVEIKTRKGPFLKGNELRPDDTHPGSTLGEQITSNPLKTKPQNMWVRKGGIGAGVLAVMVGEDLGSRATRSDRSHFAGLMLVTLIKLDNPKWMERSGVEKQGTDGLPGLTGKASAKMVPEWQSKGKGWIYVTKIDRALKGGEPNEGAVNGRRTKFGNVLHPLGVRKEGFALAGVKWQWGRGTLP